MKIAEKIKAVIQYKGYTITFVNGKWRARAYSNPDFDNANLQLLKREINKYLNS